MGSQPATTSIDRPNRKRDDPDTNPFSAKTEDLDLDLDLNGRANQLASENGPLLQQQQQKLQQQQQQQQQQQPSPKQWNFTVTYSHLCDGGMQEMSTAVAGVRDVFPDASIRTHRRTPLEDQESFRNGESAPSVIVSLHQHQHQIRHRHGNQHRQKHHCEDNGACDSSNKKPGVWVLWSANQRHLYLKNPKKRRKSVKHLRKTLLAAWNNINNINNNINNINNNISSSSFSSSSSSLSSSFATETETATATATPPEDDGDPTGSSSTRPNVVPGTRPNAALVVTPMASGNPTREREEAF